MTKLYPLLFEPNLKEVVWGGTYLKQWKHLPIDGTPIGESWEVSSIAQHESIVSNGPLKGIGLNTITRQYGARILGDKVVAHYGKEIPLLVKFIDAAKDLSIQVHPDDDMAQRYHQSRGKTEMWYILDAQPGASILAGFKKQISPEEYAQRVKDGTIVDVLARHYVKPGDVFFIPAGRVHAICAGIKLVEIQQSSDITYRIFDYDRPGLDGKLRPLHTELASEALNYEVLPEYRTLYQDHINRAVPIVRSPYFDMRLLQLTAPIHRDLKKYDSFIITVCVKGKCLLRPRGGNNPEHDDNIQERSNTAQVHSGNIQTSGGNTLAHAGNDVEEIILEEGHSALIPKEIADYDIIPQSPEVCLLDTYLNNMDNSLAAKWSRVFHLSFGN